MYHVRNALRILIVLTVICAASVATVSAAGYVIGSATKPVSVSNTAPTFVTASGTGVSYVVGGTSPMGLLAKWSKANNLGLAWDDTAPAGVWVGANPAKMKGMSVIDVTAANWGVYLAAQGMYDASTKNFNWNGAAANWVPVAAAGDTDLLNSADFAGAGTCTLIPGVATGNAYDKGVWVILGHWAAGDPAAAPPGFAPDNWVAVFVSTGQANVRVETTYPTAWFLVPLFPLYTLNWPDTAAAPLYMQNLALGGVWAAYTGGVAPDQLLYIDTTKVKERHTFLGVGQGTNYVYVAPNDGAGAPFLPKMKTVKTTVKRGVTATAKATLK